MTWLTSIHRLTLLAFFSTTIGAIAPLAVSAQEIDVIDNDNTLYERNKRRLKRQQKRQQRRHQNLQRQWNDQDTYYYYPQHSHADDENHTWEDEEGGDYYDR